jgi:putative ABC transport system permease protein
VSLQGNTYENYANLIKNHSGIAGVSGSSVVLATGGTSYSFLKRMDDPHDSTGMTEMFADRNFIENFGLNFIAGTNFPEEPAQESESCFLVNETGAKKLGYDNPLDIIGETFKFVDFYNPLTVMGVVKDFHYTSLIQEVGPFIIRYNPEKFRYANIRIHPGAQESVMDYMAKKWKEMDQDHAFDSQFMDQQLAESNAIFGDIGFIIGFISILAVSIACLGLLGMVIFVVQTRIKEIGIRKVHGATSRDAVWVLSKGFLILLIIAVFIATPFAKLINEMWLREFAVRIEFGIGILGMGILMMLILGLATIFSQTVKSASNNPIEALRYE